METLHNSIIPPNYTAAHSPPKHDATQGRRPVFLVFASLTYRVVGERRIGDRHRTSQLFLHVELDLACCAMEVSGLQPPRHRRTAATHKHRDPQISPTDNPLAYTREDCAAAHVSRHKAPAATCWCHGQARRQRCELSRGRADG